MTEKRERPKGRQNQNLGDVGSNKPRPNFKSWDEVNKWVEETYGVKTVDKTEEMKGKAIIFIPGMVYRIEE